MNYCSFVLASAGAAACSCTQTQLSADKRNQWNTELKDGEACCLDCHHPWRNHPAAQLLQPSASQGFAPSLSSVSSSASSSLFSSSAAATVPEDVAMRGFFDSSRLLFLRRGLCAAARQQLEQDAHYRGRQVRDILAQIDSSFENAQSAIVQLIRNNQNICEDTFQNLNLAVHSAPLPASKYVFLPEDFDRAQLKILIAYFARHGKSVALVSSSGAPRPWNEDDIRTPERERSKRLSLSSSSHRHHHQNSNHHRSRHHDDDSDVRPPSVKRHKAQHGSTTTLPAPSRSPSPSSSSTAVSSSSSVAATDSLNP